MIRFLSVIVSLFVTFPFVSAQIPTALTSKDGNAVSVVNNYEAVFTQTDLNNATYKVTKSVTIFEKQGEGYGYFRSSGDKFRELKDFSGVVKSITGAVIRKIGKKDLVISSLSDQMATDSYSIMYNCKATTYPYTVEYTYEERWKNGVIVYPLFDPIDGYMQSVTKATYTIELPVDMDLRYNTNFDCQIKDEKTENKHIYSFSVQNLSYIESEALSPFYKEIFPQVLIAPNNFCFDSYCGNMSDWKNYGNWILEFLKNQDVLPADFVSKIKDITKDAGSDREKVEILYKYLQNNWRYVSIQLGIGGWKPINAMSVSKTNYGDCKGLTNLMKAMLKALDIPSNYCTIYLGDKKYFTKDFTNLNEFNHAILLVPLKNDSIWLECTSQRLPFGYVHEDIAGHDVLVVTDDGGKMCRLPVYTDSLNRKQSTLIINLTEDGSARGEAVFVENLHGYSVNEFSMTSKDRDIVVRYLNRNLKLPKAQFNQVQAKENKSSMPSCTLTANFDAAEFANKTGSRLFIPACPLNKKEYSVFSSKNRNHDIVINNGYSQADTIIYNLPNGYVLESSPKDISVETPYGTFLSSAKQEDGRVIYSQNTVVFTGKYDKSEYPSYKAFYEQIANASKQRFVLKKAE
ncbi:hypothetical protein GGR21_000442 [Dysgonomonas hofstadii]|uniref:DUF3857 domain-containing protein n=1 Tax=Dysgonomonas hofstadii TaxID=637886 RepID=A0A840CNI4_9BACT|nr:DUF3857 domain-containing protein [Dysgonomonas hofstadii]MBB4034555.1 hypothetical protein [Dysgonomonas hofstadii]